MVEGITVIKRNEVPKTHRLTSTLFEHFKALKPGEVIEIKIRELGYTISAVHYAVRKWNKENDKQLKVRYSGSRTEDPIVYVSIKEEEE